MEAADRRDGPVMMAAAGPGRTAEPSIIAAMATASFVQRNGPNMRVRDVNVNLARNGAIYLAFQAQGYRGRLDFSGRAMRFNRDSVDATLNGPGEMRANAMIYVNRDGSVDRIDMSGRGRDGDFRLNWRSR